MFLQNSIILFYHYWQRRNLLLLKCIYIHLLPFLLLINLDYSHLFSVFLFRTLLFPIFTCLYACAAFIYGNETIGSVHIDEPFRRYIKKSTTSVVLFL